MSQELTRQQVRLSIDPSVIGDGQKDGSTKTADGSRDAEKTRPRIVGQERAHRALDFGLRVSGRGFNVFVSGHPGTGKMSSVREFVARLAAERPSPEDWCFVHNHSDAYEPRAIRLPAGKGRTFRDDLDELRRFVQEEIAQLFESDEYSARREEALKELQQRGEGLSEEVRKKAEEYGFTMRQTLMGTALVPVKDGEPLSDDEVAKLSEEEQKDIQRRREELQKEIQSSQKTYRRIDKEAKEKVKDLDRQVVDSRLEGPLDDLRERYEGNDTIVGFLSDLREDVLDNIETIKGPEGNQSQQMSPQAAQRLQFLRSQFYGTFDVNVAVDNARTEGAPVVVELNPTYLHLIGSIEKEMQMGAVSTDFTLIKAGALLQANGGYLILPVEDVLRNPYSWEALKRSLRAGEVRIEEAQQQLGLMTIKTLRPQSIPLDTKVVLVGRPLLFHLLETYDVDFRELFKVKADFDKRMDRTDENAERLAEELRSFCSEEGLLALSDGAGARVLEYAVRRGGHRDKLSVEFRELSDIVREASYWASKDQAEQVGPDHVRKALEEKIYRSGMIRDRIGELIENGTIRIWTKDREVAQVNGLSVMQLGDILFGRPNRITASVAPGREGVVDIERESRLGGPIHNKGVMILTGYLSRVAGDEGPLGLSARLVFEQSYGGVEGDSASFAELCALLSGLASKPLLQAVAVTGSVDQHGNIQAVGGINEKIEGFYDTCRRIELTGKQGVLIPASNVQNLMLREDVAASIDEGDFHLYSAAEVTEGLDVLTDGGGRELLEAARRRLEEFRCAMKEHSFLFAGPG